MRSKLIGAAVNLRPAIGVIVANDPCTGRQVAIDPLSKKAVLPSDFPLANFKVNGFQIVVLK